MKRKEYGPSDFSKMLRGLRQAAEQVQRDEFDKVAERRGLRRVFPGPSEPKDYSVLTLSGYDRKFLRDVGIDSEEAAVPKLNGR